MEAGREFQFLEVIGTNVLVNEVVRRFSNLTAKGCWESAKRVLRTKHALGEIIDFNSCVCVDKNKDKLTEIAPTPIRVPYCFCTEP